MATPAYQAAGTADAGTITSGAAWDPTCPATVTAGQILIAHISCRDTTTTPSTPSGWTLLHGPETTGTGRHWLFGKIADGTEDGTAVSFGTQAVTVNRSGRIYAFGGNDYSGQSVAAIVLGFAHGSGSTASVADTGVTTPIANCLACNFVVVNDNNTIGAFTGMTGGTWAEAVAEVSNNLGTGWMAQLQTAAMASAGTINGGTVTMSAADPWGVIGCYIREPIAPKLTTTAEVSLASANTPEARTGHIIKARARRTSLTGKLRVRLYEGATARSAELESSELTTSLATYEFNIVEADAEDITDYSDLSIRFYGYSSAGDATVFEVADIWLEIPEAALASVSQTLSPSYNVIGNVSKTLSPSYNVRVVLSKTLSPSYNIRAELSKTLTSSYNIIGGITKTLTPSYTVIAAVSKTLSASYNVQVILQKALSASYNVNSIVSKTLTPSYTVRSSVSKALTASYNVLGQTQTAVAEVSLASGSLPATRTDHFLKIRARVTTPAHVNSKIRMRLYEGATPRSAELETVNLSTALLTFGLPIDDADAEDITDYSNLSIRFYGYSSVGDASTFEVAELWLETPEAVPAVQKSLSASYNVIGVVSQTLTPSYTVKVAVSKTLSPSYNIVSLNAVSKSLSVSYNVQAQVSKALSASYNIISAGQTTVARVSLAPAKRPPAQISHAIYIRARVTGGSGTIRAALYDGATNISGTLESSALTGTLAEYVLNISDVNAANITQYQDLEIRFWGFGTGTYEVSEIWLRIPAGLDWVTKTLTPSYNILLQSVQKSLTASYNVVELGHIPKSLTATYALGGKVTKTLTATPYVIKYGPRGLHNLLVSADVASVQKTLTATYGLAGTVQKSLTASYVKRVVVNKALTATYNTRVTLQKSLSASYNIVSTSSVAKSLSASYTIRTALSKTLTASYNVKVQLQKALTASYNILSLGSVLKSLSASYNVRVTLQKPLSASYTIKTVVSKALAASYIVKSARTKTLTASYTVNGGVAKTLTSTYSVRAIVTQQFTAIYSLGFVIVKSLTGTYTVRAFATKPLTVNYSIVGQVSKTLTANFLLGDVLFASFTADYWIHDPLEPAPPYQPTGVIVGVNGASSIDITVQKPTGSVIKVP